jgi:hypothetical protein
VLISTIFPVEQFPETQHQLSSAEVVLLVTLVKSRDKFFHTFSTWRTLVAIIIINMYKLHQKTSGSLVWGRSLQLTEDS